MFDPSKYTVQKAKPIPVLLLLDVSGSMSGAPIQELNKALKEMLSTFSQTEKMETEIIVSIITFGNEVIRNFPFTKASEINFKQIDADGMTPMGSALRMAKDMIEDKNETPSRAYRPTVVLLSDGAPNDEWESPLKDFISNGRSAKCDRMAMAIGQGADESVLNRFIQGCEHPLFRAENASEISSFFQKVTMSVTTRLNSKNPNEVPKLSYDNPIVETKANDDDDGFF